MASSFFLAAEKGGLLLIGVAVFFSVPLRLTQPAEADGFLWARSLELVNWRHWAARQVLSFFLVCVRVFDFHLPDSLSNQLEYPTMI